MNDKFYEQKKEKQDLMINGAMEIFAQKGFRHSAIDDMVKVSGVSKGLWFHYFENKVGLYSFVVDYAVKYAMLEYDINIKGDSFDYFDFIMNIENVKLELMDKYPYLPLLLISIEEEDDSEAVALIKETRQAYNDYMTGCVMKADKGMWDDENDFTLMSEMLRYTLRNMMRQYYKEPVFRKESYSKKTEQYVKMLKKMAQKC